MSNHLTGITEPTKLVSTSGIEYGGSISAEYAEIYHVVNDTAWTGSYSVVRKYENGIFGKEDTVRFNGKVIQGGDVHLSHDGERIYITSRYNEDSTKNDGNIWTAQRMANGWSEIERMPATINSELGEYSPSSTKTGNLYFARFSEESSGDVFMSKYENGKYLEAVKLSGLLNSDSLEADPWVSPNEDFILFIRRSGINGFGVTDIFISFNEQGIWSEAYNLGKEYNSHGVDGSPMLTPDGKYLIFTTNRDSNDPTNFDGGLDIYVQPFDLDKVKRLTVEER